MLASFKDGRMPIMCATDVAARGLDVKDVAAVVNYDFPNGVEDYIHRIGRTGRAGATGIQRLRLLCTTSPEKQSNSSSQCRMEIL